MNFLCEKYEKITNSRSPFWIPSGVPLEFPPESLWDSSRITIHTVHKVWAGRFKPFQRNHTMNLLCENYEKSMSSRIPFWIPSAIPLEFRPNRSGINFASLSILGTRFGLDVSGLSNAIIL